MPDKRNTKFYEDKHVASLRRLKYGLILGAMKKSS